MENAPGVIRFVVIGKKDSLQSVDFGVRWTYGSLKEIIYLDIGEGEPG